MNKVVRGDYMSQWTRIEGLEPLKKIRAKDVILVVEGTKEKPYYGIQYYDMEKEETYLGFGSYNLNYVFDWKEQYFEIVNEKEGNA